VRRRETVGALAAFTLLTLAFTWPLARGLDRDLAGDPIDPLLNAWILASDADHLGGLLTGRLSALRDYWQPGIFAPHPLTLAYSEHLTPQAIQILPFHLAARNPILSYNLLFLSTFVLSALGMFLFVREVTGSAAAGLLAGVAFGYAPYRVAQITHVQVLSAAWMPFTLFFLRRFFDHRRLTALAWAGAAWVTQNLSCGYYLLFFSPVVAGYAAWELSARRLWSDRRVLQALAIMAGAVGAATAPFLWPYLELRELGFAPRTIDEAVRFHADMYSFFTASGMLKLWGSTAQAFPVTEGELFPGVTVTVVAGFAMVAAWRSARARAPVAGYPTRALGWLLAGAGVICVALFLGSTIRVPSTRPIVKITDLWRAVGVTGLMAAGTLTVSRPARAIVRGWLATEEGFFTLVTLFAALMALGPEISAGGRRVDAFAPYQLFHRYVPGFDGLRVPARFGMVLAFSLGALGGLGAARLARRAGGRTLTAIAAALILAESWPAPILINQQDTRYAQEGLAPLPDGVALDDRSLPVYQFLSTLPAGSVLLELPLGEPAFDVRYMAHAIDHRQRLVNGFSGGSPVDYQLLAQALMAAPSDPQRAWNALTTSAATHVVVHEHSYANGRGAGLTQWLAHNGAREVAAFDGDRVFTLPR
jgi:hypothetical protein